MKKTKYVRVEASVLLQYEEELDSLPHSLPDPEAVELAMSKVIVAAFKKYTMPAKCREGGKKAPQLTIVGPGRFNFELHHEKKLRRVADIPLSVQLFGPHTPPPEPPEPRGGKESKP